MAFFLVPLSLEARALHEAQVKSVDTAQRLANLHEVSKTRASEQWSLLSDCLAAAARCDVTSVGSIKQGAKVYFFTTRPPSQRDKDKLITWMAC
eukprot:4576499-Amphidinium_carterae.1